MSQEDYTINNATGAAVRSDINSTLSAIVTANSGASEPATMFPYQIWADTTSTKLKIRNGANNAWYDVGSLDTANLGLMLASYFPNITGNITSSHTELNKLDGFTGSVTDLNYAKDLRAKGVTATEFDTLDGITSSIQPQLNTLTSDKAPKNGSTSNLFSVKTPTSSNHATTKSYVDGTYSVAETGYQKFPSGLIMQWGRKSVPNSSNTTVTLPIAFPNDLFTLHGTPNDNRASNDYEVDHYSVACKDTGSLSTFTIMSEGTSAGTMTIFWQAIGF